MTIDKEDMVEHFTAYGDVTGISMNPTRGYAFIDYRNNECVQSALRQGQGQGKWNLEIIVNLIMNLVVNIIMNKIVNIIMNKTESAYFYGNAGYYSLEYSWKERN